MGCRGPEHELIWQHLQKGVQEVGAGAAEGRRLLLGAEDGGRGGRDSRVSIGIANF